ncbi:phage holin [Cytobacillus horneckiae]|uniref:Phage holin n=2 Tax=Cytobacillus horneckiae TaxID=549687 RepID=A0A2N0ZMX9_9BACI|nr:phage holin [Cytobacillus horneckiae]MED2940643.1 phage holin [Cytobacillus horneckiae]PKG30870.1 phage holin [Cytobacillus horneckiae]
MDKGTVIRTAVLLVALVNQFLVATGLNPIPGSEQLWGEVVSTIFTGAAATWAWFKNNYITAIGKRQRATLRMQKLTK